MLDGPVAVLGDADLDVFDIVPETARLGDPALTDPLLGGAAPVAPTSFEYADVDDDGDEDLVLVFDVGAMEAAGAIAQSSSMLTLEAEKSSGRFVFGSDLVHPKTKKPKKPKKHAKSGNGRSRCSLLFDALGPCRLGWLQVRVEPGIDHGARLVRD